MVLSDTKKLSRVGYRELWEGTISYRVIKKDLQRYTNNMKQDH